MGGGGCVLRLLPGELWRASHTASCPNWRRVLGLHIPHPQSGCGPPHGMSIPRHSSIGRQPAKEMPERASHRHTFKGRWGGQRSEKTASKTMPTIDEAALLWDLPPSEWCLWDPGPGQFRPGFWAGSSSKPCTGHKQGLGVGGGTEKPNQALSQGTAGLARKAHF